MSKYIQIPKKEIKNILEENDFFKQISHHAKNETMKTQYDSAMNNISRNFSKGVLKIKNLFASSDTPKHDDIFQKYANKVVEN